MTLFRTNWSSNQLVFGPMGLWTNGFSDQWVVRPMGFWTNWSTDQLIIGQMGHRTNGPSDQWAVGPSALHHVLTTLTCAHTAMYFTLKSLDMNNEYALSGSQFTRYCKQFTSYGAGVALTLGPRSTLGPGPSSNDTCFGIHCASMGSVCC